MPCRPLAVAFLFVTALLGQQPADPIPKLLLDLGDDGRCLTAVRNLCALQADAVAPLLAFVQSRRDAGPEDRACLMAVYALGKLGDAGALAARPMLEHLRTATGSLQLQLLWAIGEVGPAAAASDPTLQESLRERRPQPGTAHQEWAIACRRIDLGLQPRAEQLDLLANAEDLGGLTALADHLLRDPRPLQGEARDSLLQLFRRVLAEHTCLVPGQPYQGGFQLAPAQKAVAVDNGMERAVRELARAVVARVPDAPERVAASVLLTAHFDPDVRFQAMRGLGAGNDALALAGLRVGLLDSQPLVRCEAVTALGMLGPLATEATHALETLADGDDKQLAGRATASLRAIRKKG